MAINLHYLLVLNPGKMAINLHIYLADIYLKSLNPNNFAMIKSWAAELPPPEQHWFSLVAHHLWHKQLCQIDTATMATLLVLMLIQFFHIATSWPLQSGSCHSVAGAECSLLSSIRNLTHIPLDIRQIFCLIAAVFRSHKLANGSFQQQQPAICIIFWK